MVPISPPPPREHPAGGPARPMAGGAEVHAAGLPVRGPRCPQRPEGDLPGEGAAAPPGAGGVPAAQRHLEGQVHVSDQLWVPGRDWIEPHSPRRRDFIRSRCSSRFNASFFMSRSHSEFQVILVQQVRPRHPESRNSHRQESGKSVQSIVHSWDDQFPKQPPATVTSPFPCFCPGE